MAKPSYQEMQLLGQAENGGKEEVIEQPSCIATYFKKMKGAGDAGPPQLSLTYSAFSFLGAFVGMSAIGLMHSYVMVPDANMVLLVGAFGAMSVIVFSAFKAPVAQPKNVIIGNTLGGLVGVLVFDACHFVGLGTQVWLMAALSVSLTIVVQELTGTVHPPGGATALIYTTMPPVQYMGYKFVFCPSFLGAVIMVVVACITNNLSGERTYPLYWWPGEAKEVEAKGGIMGYFLKFRGAGAAGFPSPPLAQTWCSFLGSFVGIATLALLHFNYFMKHGEVLMIGAFGAMSVIIFSAWKVPFAQPKNALIGNTIGGFVGVSVYNLMQLAGLGGQLWLGAALSVALTITIQELTNTVHPPGGATALLFDIVPLLHKQEYMFVFTPSFLGTLILVLIGCLSNNLVSARSYPQFWFPGIFS